MGSSPVYLDYNATAPLAPGVRQAMDRALTQVGNPSSQHGFGRRARSRIEEVRDRLREFAGAANAAVIFTSGASEANNLVLRGVGADSLLVSAVEHDSVLYARSDASIIGVDPGGRVDLDRLEDHLRRSSGKALVSVMAANNETGILQDIAALSRLTRAHGAILHCDAVQIAGRLPLTMEAWGVDALSLSGHKFGAPPGVGALLIDPKVDLAALIRGGGQEDGARAGTQNVAAIAGLGAAIRAARPRADAWQAMRDAMEKRLAAAFDGIIIVGRDRARLPQTSCFALPGVEAQTLVIACDLAGFGIGAGSACSSGRIAPSRVLTAMGADPALAAGAVRVSFGTGIEDSHLRAFTRELGRIRSRADSRGKKHWQFSPPVIQ